MISLQTLLASGWKEKLPLICMIAAAVVLLWVFVSGMVKGFSRVGKGGLAWGFASGLFIVLHKFVPNPFTKAADGGFWKNNCGVIWGTCLLLVVVLMTLIGWCALGAIFAPQKRRRIVNPYEYESAQGTTTAITEGFEYELDDVVDTYYTRRQKTRYEMARETSPGILARLMGGVLAVINLAIVLAGIALVGLLAVDVLNLGGGVSKLVGSSIGDPLEKYITPYVLDIVTVGLMLFVGYQGFYAGTIGFTRSLLMKIGLLLVIVCGFAAPFIKQVADIGFVDTLINRCAKLYNKVDVVPQSFLGKVTVGAMFVVAGCIVVAILNYLLKLLMDIVESDTILRAIDGALATLIYLALGLAVCAIFWGGLYCLDVTNIFQVEEVISEKSFSFECFGAAKKALADFAQKYLLRFA